LEAPTEGTGAEPLIRRLRSVPTGSPDTWDVVVLKLALAGALGLILALVYRASYTGKRKKYKPSMMQCQLLLCVGGAMIWIIVSGNIVRAFGLAGALSLIRYRTPVRDPKDTVVVFLSMLVGMACGLALYYVALIATGFISLLLFGIYEFRLGKKKKKPKAEKPALFED
jgi:O-antigen/teichoic acid export membrane protein